MNDLRPTLFLAQLSNLLAGNIAIVHGVTGSSRTFMGEEAAGVDAARIALARIAAGQSDIALVGGSQNGERKDLLVLYEFGDFNLKDKFAPVWARQKNAGFALGSAGAFLVMESKAHAEARGAKPFARLTNVVADLARRKHPARSQRRWKSCGRSSAGSRATARSSRARPAPSRSPRKNGRSSASIRTSRCARPARCSVTPWKRSFRSGLALAALSISRGALFPPNDPTGLEVEMSKPPTQIVVIGAGHWRGEGMALVEAIK